MNPLGWSVDQWMIFIQLLCCVVAWGSALRVRRLRMQMEAIRDDVHAHCRALEALGHQIDAKREAMERAAQRLEAARRAAQPSGPVGHA